jgi:hypothetical protein
LIEWKAFDQLEVFVRSGTALDLHNALEDEHWALYQRGMRNVASLSAAEVARRVPVPKRARDMLDIGGSHGYHSVVICKRHPGLRSTILDLPQAVKHAVPILERERMGDRVTHRVGDATTEDLGVEAFDLVYIANLRAAARQVERGARKVRRCHRLGRLVGHPELDASAACATMSASAARMAPASTEQVIRLARPIISVPRSPIPSPNSRISSASATRSSSRWTRLAP